MRILIISDAWYPQINGVVRCLSTTADHLRALGHEVEVIGPDRFKSIPAPTYPEIKLALFPARKLKRLIEAFRPVAIHIATEGPLGLAGRNYCARRGFQYTTSFHTMFPQYLRLRFGLPEAWTFAFLRWFHKPASGVMVSTDTMQRLLESHKFKDVVKWARAVDTDLFRITEKTELDDQGIKRPVAMLVGRVAVEKNIEKFLDMAWDGTKVVVGDGPQLAEMKKRYPDVLFTGAKTGEDLVRHYNAADVFAFPSKSETFGLVMLEAMACGVPVAAYPVMGPNDVVGDSGAGVLGDDLATASKAALAIDPQICRAHALKFSWDACTQEFLQNLAPMERPVEPEV